MSTRVQFRRGTTAEHATFAGAEGEITVDTEKKSLVVHDGVTVGGIPVGNLPWIVASSATTAEESQKIAADVSGGPWTLTLPASPDIGISVTVSVIAGDPSQNNLTIVGNPHNIQGDATLVWDVGLSPVTITLIFNGTEWRIA